MNDKDAVKDVESLNFSCFVNIASSLSVFIRAAEEKESVQYLIGNAKNRTLIRRVERISKISFDKKFEHPGDAALAIYFWIAYQKKDKNLEKMKRNVQGISNCFWAKRMINYINELEEEKQ